DFKYAIRTFLRTPGFTLVAVLTLALGVGATTAMFSVVNAVLIRPLPFTDPDRLVATRGSLADLRDLQAGGRAFDDIAFWASNQFNLRLDGDSRQVLGGQVTTNLFPLLGVQPVLGRAFAAQDDRQNVVVLGYALWQSRFGGDPGVLGRTVQLSGTSYTVVGIAPPWFRFPTAEFQLWAPLGIIDRDTPQQAANRAFRIFSAVGRLKAGVSVEQAQADAQAISTRLAREFPTTNEGVVFTVRGFDLLPAVIEARVPRADGIRIDGTVLAFSVCATMLTGLFFGLAPALHAARGVAGPLKDSGRGVAGSARGRRLRRAIVITETALAVSVLVGAG